MIRAFLGQVFADPDVTNERAVRCYAAAGFRVVGPVRTPDGQALLMRCTRQSLQEA